MMINTKDFALQKLDITLHFYLIFILVINPKQ